MGEWSERPDGAALQRRFEAAEPILRAAGATALSYFNGRDRLAIERKGRQDLVSIADREVERAIRRAIAAAFPDDAIFGEEDGGAIGDPCWVIDPIDGTANFLRGLPYWCCTFAFVQGGRTRFGLTYDPCRDEMFAALEGEGATRNGAPIEVSAIAAPEEACISVSFTYKQAGAPYFAMLERLIAKGLDHRRMGSAALQLAHVADGRVEGTLCQRLNSWDVLAGLLLVREAGGGATRWEDGAGLDQPRAIAAGNAALFAEVEALCFEGLERGPDGAPLA